MYRVRNETIYMWTTQGQAKNENIRPFLSKQCTNKFKESEVAIQIWLSIKDVTKTRTPIWPGETRTDPKFFQCRVKRPNLTRNYFSCKLTQPELRIREQEAYSWPGSKTSKRITPCSNHQSSQKPRIENRRVLSESSARFRNGEWGVSSTQFLTLFLLCLTWSEPK